MKQPKVGMDKESWQKGYQAGLNGEANEPPEGVEVLSWHSGYIEGEAERKKNFNSPGQWSGAELKKDG